MSIHIHVKTAKYKFFLIAFFASIFVRYLADDMIMPACGAMIFFGILCWIFLFAEFKAVRKITSVLVFLDMVSLIACLINGNVEIYYVALLMGYQGIALSLLIYNENFKILNILFWAVLIFFFAVVILRKDFDSLFYLASENYVSVFLVFFLSTHIIYKNMINKPISIIPCLLVFILCILASGKGGILASGIMLIGVMGVSSKRRGFPVYSKILLLCMIFLVIFFVYKDPIANTLNNFYKMEGRIGLWEMYFLQLKGNFNNIIFGAVGYSKSGIMAKFGHMHNTFLNLHYYFGLLPLIVFIICLIRLLKNNIKKHDYMKAVIIFASVARSMTDITAFPGIFDVLWYYLFFDLFCKEIIINKIRKGSIMNADMVNEFR